MSACFDILFKCTDVEFNDPGLLVPWAGFDEVLCIPVTAKPEARCGPDSLTSGYAIVVWACIHPTTHFDKIDQMRPEAQWCPAETQFAAVFGDIFIVDAGATSFGEFLGHGSVLSSSVCDVNSSQGPIALGSAGLVTDENSGVNCLLVILSLFEGLENSVLAVPTREFAVVVDPIRANCDKKVRGVGHLNSPIGVVSGLAGVDRVHDDHLSVFCCPEISNQLFCAVKFAILDSCRGPVLERLRVLLQEFADERGLIAVEVEGVVHLNSPIGVGWGPKPPRWSDFDAVGSSVFNAKIGERDPVAPLLAEGRNQTCLLEIGEVAALRFIDVEDRGAIPVGSVLGQLDEERVIEDCHCGHFNSPFGGGHLGSRYTPYALIDQKRKAKKHFC